MISVIVPIYNVEEYLDDCINSLLNQTYRDLEIVLVDDGSTDRSGIICDFYGEKDNRIKVLHKENGGLMSAWKYGVLKARGDYIVFVDSDDWIDKDMYQRLFERISESNADIVLCGLIKEFSNNKTEDEVQMLKRDFYSSEQVVREILPIALCSGVKPNRGISPNRVTKLYKIDFQTIFSAK